MDYQIKNKSDVHLARKLWHLTGVLIIVITYQLLPYQWAVGLLAGLTIFALVLELLRQRSGKVNTAVLTVFGPLMREHEHHGLTGTTYVLLGASLVIALFPAPVATLSLLFLGLGDPVSSYVGIRYGKYRILGRKTLQGTLAGFATCTALALIFYVTRDMMTERLLIVSLISGFAGAVSELLPIGSLDDNLSQPVLSASMLYIIFHIFDGII